MDPTADRYVGIRITGDFAEQIMGIIYAPFPLPAPAPQKPNPVLPPANRPATYVGIFSHRLSSSSFLPLRWFLRSSRARCPPFAHPHRHCPL